MKKNLLLNSALTLLAVMITLQVCAQQRFDQRRIYQIVSVLHPDKVLGFDGTGGQVILKSVDKADKNQFWTISELSGSFRFSPIAWANRCNSCLLTTLNGRLPCRALRW